LTALEAVDVPQQVVGVLDAFVEVAALPGPFDGVLVVGVEGLSELSQVMMDLGALAYIEGGSADVVDRWERLHTGSSPDVGAEEVHRRKTLESCQAILSNGCYMDPVDAHPR
jgi:hypothetical protein